MVASFSLVADVTFSNGQKRLKFLLVVLRLLRVEILGNRRMKLCKRCAKPDFVCMTKLCSSNRLAANF